MSSKKRGELQLDPKPDTKNDVNDTQSQQPPGSRGRQEGSASKSRGPSGKTSDATAGRDKPASETQLQPPPRERQRSEPSPAAHGGGKTTAGPVSVKPVEKSEGAKPSSACAEAASPAMSPPTSWKGTKVVPEEKPWYTTKSQLGKGAYGEVWKVKLEGPEVPFAIKQVEIFESIEGRDTTLTKEKNVELYKEPANQKKCADKSSFVLPIFAWSVELFGKSLRLLMAMPICAGPLDSFIEKDGIQKKYEPYIKLFTLELSKAVATLHELHVVHGDIRNDNVFIYIGADGRPPRLVLGEFGLSIDFSVKDQAELAKESELQLQVRDRCGVAGCYLSMQYGGSGGLHEYGKTVEERLSEYYAKLELGDLEGPARTRKLNERGFVFSMVDSTGETEPSVPAKQTELHPFFN